MSNENFPNTTAYPLCWPENEERLPSSEVRRAKFSRKNDQGWGGSKPLTIAQATKRLNKQISAYTKPGKPWRINPDTVIISSNMVLNKDRSIRSGQRDPSDPAVAVYYVLDGDPKCIPMDTYDRVSDNIASIAQCLADMRSLERHGHRISSKVYNAFTALPTPDQVTKTTWRDVLEYYGHSLEEAKTAYRKKASENHPDRGGDQEKLTQINLAWEQAQEALKPCQET